MNAMNDLRIQINLKHEVTKLRCQNTKKVYITLVLISRAKHLTIDCFFSFKNLVVSLSNLASKALTSLSNSLISLKKNRSNNIYSRVSTQRAKPQFFNHGNSWSRLNVLPMPKTESINQSIKFCFLALTLRIPRERVLVI